MSLALDHPWGDSSDPAACPASSRMAADMGMAHSIVPVVGITLKNAASQAWVVLDVRALPPDGANCAVDLMREDDFHAGDRRQVITLTAAQFQDFCVRHRILPPRAR